MAGLTLAMQERICEAIRNGHTQGAAARSAGIRPETLSRWLREGRKHSRGRYRRLLKAVNDARSSLCEVLDNIEIEMALDPETPHAVRLRAVQAIRQRVFGVNNGPHSQHVEMQVYNFGPTLNVQAGDSKPEDPPRQLLSNAELVSLSDERLTEVLDVMRRAKAELAGQQGATANPNVIDAEPA